MIPALKASNSSSDFFFSYNVKIVQFCIRPLSCEFRFIMPIGQKVEFLCNWLQHNNSKLLLATKKNISILCQFNLIHRTVTPSNPKYFSPHALKSSYRGLFLIRALVVRKLAAVKKWENCEKSNGQETAKQV